MWFALSAGDLRDHLDWADWMRRHASDPAWRQEVIRVGPDSRAMHWERWSDWRAGDPRWRVHVIDTSDIPVERVADELAAWIDGKGRSPGWRPLGFVAV